MKELAASFYPEHARAIFDNELPECARCGTKINVSFDEYTGLFLCEWCGWPELEKEVKKRND